MYIVTKESPLMEVLENAPETVPFFNAIGMHCLSCTLGSSENVEQACAAHGYDADDFVMQLNAYIAQQAELSGM